jgi:LPS export ABC transporter permease LptF/LPS export ABC transporter permease LptG
VLKILDRYLVREIVIPFLLVLLGLTFALEMPPILQQGEKLIEKGVQWHIVAQVLLTLLPQALGVTIPMSLLLGILVGLGRCSADREFVALQACGVSVFRILRPLAFLALAASAATAYVMIVALPNANQRFREITFNVVASRAEGDVKPRVFFEDFPSRVVYVRDIPATGGWRDVFLADSTHPDHTDVYFARQGRLLIDRGKKTVQLLLENGTRHTTYGGRPQEYEGSSFDRLILNMDAETVFPRTQVMKGDPEMTIAELRAVAAENLKRGVPAYGQLFMIQQKFSLPVACLVLALIGLALGVTNRKEGKLAGFVLGIGVLFVYYVLLYAARGLAMGGRMSPAFAPWLPNVALGIAGVGLVMWRAGAIDQPIRISIPTFWRPREAGPRSASGRPPVASAGRVVLVIRIPHIDWPRPSILDLYVSRQYLMVFGVSFAALIGVFYISTFIDLADKLYRGSANAGLLLRYFYWETPQYVYYIIPLSVLVATLVTVGLLTKNSELIVMRACGVSLYRSAVPILLFGFVFSGVLFELQERVLAETNKEAQRLNAIIRGWPVQTIGALNRRWIVGRNGDIYHYDFFNPRTNQFSGLWVFHPDVAAWRLEALTYVKDVSLERRLGADGQPALMWTARQGWDRAFTTTTRPNDVRTSVNYKPFAERPVSLEPPAYFKTDEPDADRMTYGQLKGYVTVLQASGSLNVVPYLVQLQRKIAFPFVSVIMTLLAVPFAVTTGRRGAMYGIGAGLVLALVYWTALSIFGALGSGGWISPLLAAWAPNILFGAAAVYLLLTVRT